MNGETLLAEAIEMKDEIVENRRAIHRAPEVGAHLPQTVQFVEEKLRLLGYEPRELGGGVVAELTGEDMGRCILLRADMDALKVREKTDLPFRSENGSMHACGHDMHAAMLLGAARLLKAHQSELKGASVFISFKVADTFSESKSRFSLFTGNVASVFSSDVVSLSTSLSGESATKRVSDDLSSSEVFSLFSSSETI